MVNATGLQDFFTQTYTGAQQHVNSYGQGYVSGNLDILLQKSRRSKTISEAKIWDYVRVENDPNFGRARSSDKFSKLISKLTTTRSIITILTSQIYMARVHEFLPENLRNLLFNLTSIIDTNINLLDNFEKQIIFSQIEQALFADLQIEFLGGTITFNEIVNVVNNILENSPFEDTVKNDGLRPLLSLGIQNLLPDSMVAIFDSLVYLDLLDTIFIEDDANKFNTAIKARLETFSDNEINTLVTSSNYNNLDITFSDPMGLIAQVAFQSELTEAYNNELQNAINDIGVQYNLSTEDNKKIYDMLSEDAENNVNSAFKGTVGLPSLFSVTKGLSSETHNKTLTAINNSFNTLTNTIIADAGLKATSSDPLDYLVNIKTNLKKRLEYSRRGASSEEFVEIDNFLSSVVEDGKITNQVLEDLDKHLDELLRTEDTGR